jgi:hypothetical protein
MAGDKSVGFACRVLLTLVGWSTSSPRRALVRLYSSRSRVSGQGSPRVATLMRAY